MSIVNNIQYIVSQERYTQEIGIEKRRFYTHFDQIVPVGDISPVQGKYVIDQQGQL